MRDEVRRGRRTRTIGPKAGNGVVTRLVIAFKNEKDADRDARIILMGTQ